MCTSTLYTSCCPSFLLKKNSQNVKLTFSYFKQVTHACRLHRQCCGTSIPVSSGIFPSSQRETRPVSGRSLPPVPQPDSHEPASVFVALLGISDERSPALGGLWGLRSSTEHQNFNVPP